MHPANIPAYALAVALAASGVSAQTAMDPSGSGIITGEQYANAIRADEAIGADVYSMNDTYVESAWDAADWYDGVGADWENVGEVEDIIISRNGRVIGVVVETGGWLDIGDESYVIDLRDLRMVGEGDDVDFVTRLSQEQMEAQPRAPEDSWF
jgi:hypothetical protein